MLLGRLRVRLVDDWHQAWRWSSVRLIAVSAALQTVLLAFPLKDYVPTWIIQGIATGILVITLLAAAGRATVMEKADEHINDR